jgi:hypothetical protein
MKSLQERAAERQQLEDDMEAWDLLTPAEKDVEIRKWRIDNPPRRIKFPKLKIRSRRKIYIPKD